MFNWLLTVQSFKILKISERSPDAVFRVPVEGDQPSINPQVSLSVGGGGVGGGAKGGSNL